jgi:hypothetical protein
MWTALLLAYLPSGVIPAAVPPGEFETSVAPFLAQHCIECHSGAKAKGDLDLAALAKNPSVLGSPQTWANMAQRVRAGEMPPPKRARPDAAEQAALVAWLERAGASALVTTRDPVLRRLTRYEYQRSVSDVLGVDFDAAALLPPDEVAGGFDNNGAAQGLSDALLERYLLAAEDIAEKAFLDPDDAHAARERLRGAELVKGAGGNKEGDRYVLFSNGEAALHRPLPRAGEYVVRARVYGKQAGADPCRAALSLDGVAFARFDVPATKGAPMTLEGSTRAPAGGHNFGVQFLNDYFEPKAEDANQRDRNLYVEWIEVEGPVDPPAFPAFQRRFALGKSKSAKSVLGELLLRAWRRPASAKELDELALVVSRAASFEAGLRTAAQIALCSPHFLLRVEPDAPGGKARELDAYELATRLSYFVWSSAPDDELLALAAKGLLTQEGGLRTQVSRLLRDPRASALAENFAEQWLGLRRLESFAPDPTRFPTWNAEIAGAARAETRALFECVLREDRPLRELLVPGYAFVNEPLARLYGWSSVRGAALRRVPVDGARRGGLLGQAAVLALTSNPTRTSPVKRGKFVLEALLGAPTPPPPPGVGDLSESDAPGKALSLREKLEQHRKDVSCAACHDRLDPLGFALENYDAVGVWRERENGVPVEVAGALPDGRRFGGPEELARLLADDPSFVHNVADKLAAYALGRVLAEADKAELRAHITRLGRREVRLRDLVEAVVLMDAFRRRIGQEKQP